MSSLKNKKLQQFINELYIKINEIGYAANTRRLSVQPVMNKITFQLDAIMDYYN